MSVLLVLDALSLAVPQWHPSSSQAQASSASGPGSLSLRAPGPSRRGAHCQRTGNASATGGQWLASGQRRDWDPGPSRWRVQLRRRRVGLAAICTRRRWTRTRTRITGPLALARALRPVVEPFKYFLLSSLRVCSGQTAGRLHTCGASSCDPGCAATREKTQSCAAEPDACWSPSFKLPPALAAWHPPRASSFRLSYHLVGGQCGAAGAPGAGDFNYVQVVASGIFHKPEFESQPEAQSNHARPCCNDDDLSRDGSASGITGSLSTCPRCPTT